MTVIGYSLHLHGTGRVMVPKYYKGNISWLLERTFSLHRRLRTGIDYLDRLQNLLSLEVFKNMFDKHLMRQV